MEEIEHKFVSIFDWQNDVMPYATMLTDGIECTYDLHSNLFKAYPEGKDDPDAKYAYKDMIVMLSQRVADWIVKELVTKTQLLGKKLINFIIIFNDI